MRGPQARDSKLDSSLVQVGNHLEFLRRRHALETLDLDRVERFEHDSGHLTPAMLERQVLLNPDAALGEYRESEKEKIKWTSWPDNIPAGPVTVVSGGLPSLGKRR